MIYISFSQSCKNTPPPTITLITMWIKKLNTLIDNRHETIQTRLVLNAYSVQ